MSEQTAQTYASNTTPSPTTQNTEASTVTTQATNAENKVNAFKEFELRVKDRVELVEQISGVSNDMDLWQLTYRLHSKETFRLKPCDADNRISFKFNELCRANSSISRLENFTRAIMQGIAQEDWYNTSWRISQTENDSTLTNKCTTCADKIDFCPHRMNAYIQYVCDKLNINPDEVYKDILEEKYQPKVDVFKKEDITTVPSEEYIFVDAVSAAAAAELIKLRLVRSTPSMNDRITYSYVPICEKTKSSFITSSLDFYKGVPCKSDFLNAESFEMQIDQNRNCPNCIYRQCPDKVAAYVMYLADKYGVDAVKLAVHILNTNRNGMSAKGYLNFCEKMQALDEIPLTPESRKTIDNFAKFVINKFYVKDKLVPFIPFNFTIYAKDELLADKLAGILKNFLHFYNYWDKNPVFVEYRFSDSGLDGLIDKIAKISEPTILHVKEMELLATIVANDPRANTQLKMAKLTNLIKEKNDKVFVFVSGEKSKLDTALSLYNDFYIGLLSYKLTISDMSSLKIIQTILYELREKFELEEGFDAAIERYVLDKYAESDLKSRGFIDLTKQTIIFNHFNQQINITGKLLVKDIPAATNRRTREEIWKEFDSLTGLENVKNEIRNIEQLLSFRKKTSDLGVKTMQKPNMHMVFAGNPGTGKTTVARIIAEILYNIGFIKQNKLIEVSPKDLVGMYIGHTAPKTAAICESAYDGVLFIDEAYELTVGGGSSATNQFRSECITELIKQMEDNRDRLIVIFAGYTQEMRAFLESNAGFASRVGKFIEFDDYNTEQLVTMFVNQAYNNGIRVSEKALERIEEKFEAARQLEHFGNGRYARNFFEKTLLEHAKNTFNTNDAEQLMVIDEEDIPSDI